MVVFVLTLASSKVSAQNKDNYLSINLLQSLSFSLNTVAALENQQSISNAFQIELESKKDYTVFVRVSASSTTATTPMPVNMLQLLLNSFDAKKKCDPVTTPITLSSSDQMIVISDDKSDKSGDTFNYNLRIGPIGYSYAPGTYSFTLLFTMTQQ